MPLNSEAEVLTSIESTLQCPVYWQKKYQDWAIISYYKKLIEINPTVTKRTATGWLKHDLQKLNAAFVSNKDIKRKIETMLSESVKSSDIISEFWKEHSTTLKKLALQDIVDGSTVERLLKRKATIDMAEALSSYSSTAVAASTASAASTTAAASPPEATIKKRLRKGKQKQKESETATAHDAVLVESDNVFVTGCNISVGTMIKRAAYNLHEEKRSISCRERKIMTSEQLAGISSTALQIAEYILDLTKSYSHLLLQKPPKGVTELDYYCTIWSPVFLLLFPSSSRVRVKAGESINLSSTANKKELYSESTHVKAFKIDFRFLVDVRQEEYDIGIGEYAIDSSDSKAVTDEGKLTREAKDSLDKMLRVVDEQVNTKIWTLQTLGPSCSVSMLDLVDVGLYVSNFVYDFSIPDTAAKFIKNIATILKFLFTMQRDVTRLATIIIAAEGSETNSHQNTFNRQRRPHKSNPRLCYTRDTYYTPPRGAASRLPHHYYGPPPPSVLPRLQALSGQDYVARPIDVDNEVYDIYGYRRLEDGSFYNKFSKKITKVHPMI